MMHAILALFGKGLEFCAACLCIHGFIKLNLHLNTLITLLCSAYHDMSLLLSVHQDCFLRDSKACNLRRQCSFMRSSE